MCVEAIQCCCTSCDVQTIDLERHTPAMDMFALGVILFIMLTGHKPMETGQAHKLEYSKIEADKYPRMNSSSWQRLSSPAKSLVLALLERKPEQRISAEAVRLPGPPGVCT
jgi:serine/threonine protein kinase